MEKFTKDMLETGMVLEVKCGERYLVLKGEFETEHYGTQEIHLFCDTGGFEVGSHYTDDLELKPRRIQVEELDKSVIEAYLVVKVYKPVFNSFDSTMDEDCNEKTCIWTRKESS